MSVYAVTYHPERVAPRTRTGLVGAGSIELTASGVRVVGRCPRTTLATVLAVLVALVVTFFVLLLAMNLLDAWIRANRSMRLFVAIGLCVGLGVFAGARWLALRLLPLAAFDRAIGFLYVGGARASGNAVELFTSARELTGVTSFTLAGDPSLVVDAITAAKRGGPGGYR